MKEIAVARISDLQNGQMQQIEVENSQILLSKINDQYYATSAFCTHYGAPLAKGVLSGERIVCPWHNACFNAIAGQQLEPPGLDSLTHFAVRVEGEQVLLKLPDEVHQKRTLSMARYEPSIDPRTFVVLGAGAAGMAAVEMMRQQGFQGKVILISAESKLPYDRTKLSKNYLQGNAKPDSLPVRDCKFYDDHDLELRFGQAVTKVDALNKKITFADDSELEFDSLLLATGGLARKLDIPGSNLANIFTIRQPEDVDSILDAVKDAQQAVVIGSSFIGMEAAASLTQQGLEVTVISPSKVPFEKILGEQLGRMFQQVHEAQGVKFQFETKAIELIGNEQVESVVLDNGTQIAADLVIVGIGVEPNTGYLTGVKLHEQDQSIPVNNYLQTEINDIYAAGDIARFPYAPMNKLTRIEHWRLAAQQGKIAATNMLNSNQLSNQRQEVDKIVPFFWSGQYDLKLRYVGHVEEWDEIKIEGDLGSAFLAYYLKDEQIMAVAGIDRDRDLAAISELMRLQKMPQAAAIKDTEINWLDMI
jgi:apoptosis-inducing factor 3